MIPLLNKRRLIDRWGFPLYLIDETTFENSHPMNSPGKESGLIDYFKKFPLTPYHEFGTIALWNHE